MRVVDKIETKAVNGSLRTTFFTVGKGDIVLVDNKLVTNNSLLFPVQSLMLFTRKAFGQFQFILKKAGAGLTFAFEIENGLSLSFDPCGLRSLQRIPGDETDLLFISVEPEHSIRISDQFDSSNFIQISNGVVEIA